MMAMQPPDNSPLLEGMRSLVFRGNSDARAFMDRGHCKGLDPAIFFPDLTEGMHAMHVIRAQEICHSGCPVKNECLEYALKYDEKVGVWGGESERSRRRIKRERAKQAATRKKGKR